MNSALIMSCGTVDLLRSGRDNIITNGLSNCTHMKDGSPFLVQALILVESIGSLINRHFVCEVNVLCFKS